jgi:hypothetical protein
MFVCKVSEEVLTPSDGWRWKQQVPLKRGYPCTKLHGVTIQKKNLVKAKFSPSHCRGPGSIPGQSMWDLLWTKWHWDRFFPKYFGISLSISFHRCSIKEKRRNYHLHHRVSQEASRLRCVRSFCCGALLHTNKNNSVNKFIVNPQCYIQLKSFP